MSRAVGCAVALILALSAALVPAVAEGEESMRRSNVEGMGFPMIEAERLSGSTLSLPEDGGTSATVVFIAFKRSTQEQIDAWAAQLPQMPADGSLLIYEIPMLRGRWRLLSGFIDGGMRSGIPRNQHPYVATFYGDIEPYKRALDMEDEGLCYTYVLDPQGIIRFAAAGPPEPELAAAAREVIDSLMP